MLFLNLQDWMIRPAIKEVILYLSVNYCHSKCVYIYLYKCIFLVE